MENERTWALDPQGLLLLQFAAARHGYIVSRRSLSHPAAAGHITACLDVEPEIDLDNKVHGADMGPTWGQQAPGGPHVGPWILLSGDGWRHTSLCRSPWKFIPAVWCTIAPISLLHRHSCVKSIISMYFYTDYKIIIKYPYIVYMIDDDYKFGLHWNMPITSGAHKWRQYTHALITACLMQKYSTTVHFAVTVGTTQVGNLLKDFVFRKKTGIVLPTIGSWGKKKSENHLSGQMNRAQRYIPKVWVPGMKWKELIIFSPKNCETPGNENWL